MAQFTVDGWTLEYTWERAGTYLTQSTIRVKVTVVSGPLLSSCNINSGSVKIGDVRKYITTGVAQRNSVVFNELFVVEHGGYVEKTERIDVYIYVNNVYGAHYTNIQIPAPPQPATPTKCTAPTTISVNKSIIAATDDSFTVSWSGAKGGTNNSISGYTVYWRVTENGSAPTTSTFTTKAEVNSSETSYEINLTNQTPGYKVVCGVVTKGQAGASYYSDIKTGGLVNINIRPTKPVLKIGSNVVTDTTQTILSTQSYSKKIVATTTSPEVGQAAHICYSTNPNENNPPVFPSSGTTLTPGKYYFWGWDGLSWSESAYVVIKQNVKPNISNVTGTPTRYRALGIENINGYFRGWCSNIVLNITTNKTSKISITALLYKFGKLKETPDPFPNSNYLTYSFSTKQDSGKNFTLNLEEAIKNIYGSVLKNDGKSYCYAWRLKIVAEDSVGEVSNELYYPTNDGNFFAIPGASGFGGERYVPYEYGEVANRIGWPSIGSGDFYKTARPYWQLDESIIDLETTATIKTNDNENVAYTGKINSSLNTSITNSYKLNYADITLPTVPVGKTITFTLRQKTGILIKETTFTMNIRKVPTWGTTKASSSMIKAFNENYMTNYYIFVKNPFDISNLDTAKTNYNISSVKILITRKVGNNTYSKELNPFANKTGSTAEEITNAGNYVVRLKTTEVFDFTDTTHHYDITNYKGSYQLKFQIKMINIFKEELISQPVTIDLSFDQPVKINLKSVKALNSGNSWQTFNKTNNFIQQGLKLRFTFGYTYFTNSKRIFKVFILSGGIEIGSGTIEDDEGGATDTNGVTSDDKTIDVEIKGAVSTLTSTIILAETAVGQEDNITDEYYSIIHNQATITLNSLNFENNMFDCSYSFPADKTGIEYYTGTGAPPAPTLDFQLALYTSNNKIASVWKTNVSTGNITINDIAKNGNFNFTRASFAIKLWTAVKQNFSSGTFTSEKYTTSNYITLETITPTIAYRENAVGINTRSVGNSDVLEIHAMGNKNQIHLYNTDSTYFLIDLSKGTIDYIG